MPSTLTDATAEHWQQIAAYGGPDRLEALYGQPGPQHRAIFEALREVRPASVLEIGCSVGVNLAGATACGVPLVGGIDLDAGAIEFASRLIPGVFITGDLRRALPMLAPRSWDVTISCFTLAYVSPEDIQSVWADLVEVTRDAVILAEPGPGVVGTPAVWAHDYVALGAQLGVHPVRICPIEPTEGLLSVSLWRRSDA